MFIDVFYKFVYYLNNKFVFKIIEKKIIKND